MASGRVRLRHRRVRTVPERPEVLLRHRHRALVPFRAGGRRQSARAGRSRAAPTRCSPSARRAIRSGPTPSTRSTRATPAARCASATSRCSAPTPTASTSRRPSTTSLRRRTRPASSAPQIYALDKRALAAGDDPERRALRARDAVHRDRCSPRRRRAAATRRHRAGRSTSCRAQDCEPPDCSRRRRFAREHDPRVGSHPHRDAAFREPEPQAVRPTVKSEVYGQPVPQRQKPGIHPLGESHNEPVPPVEANDARMNQVVFAGGRLWGGVNTIANPGRATASPGSRSTRALVDRSAGGHQPAGLRRRTRPHSFVSFPSIGVNDAGRA